MLLFDSQSKLLMPLALQKVYLHGMSGKYWTISSCRFLWNKRPRLELSSSLEDISSSAAAWWTSSSSSSSCTKITRTHRIKVYSPLSGMQQYCSSTHSTFWSGRVGFYLRFLDIAVCKFSHHYKPSCGTSATHLSLSKVTYLVIIVFIICSHCWHWLFSH